jgi:hypothetical protein
MVLHRHIRRDHLPLHSSFSQNDPSVGASFRRQSRPFESKEVLLHGEALYRLCAMVDDDHIYHFLRPIYHDKL